MDLSVDQWNRIRLSVRIISDIADFLNTQAMRNSRHPHGNPQHKKLFTPILNMLNTKVNFLLEKQKLKNQKELLDAMNALLRHRNEQTPQHPEEGAETLLSFFD